MSLDVHIFIDDDNENSYYDKYGNGKILGANGWLVNPIYYDWSKYRNEPVEMDFLSETPKVLKRIFEDFECLLPENVEQQEMTPEREQHIIYALKHFKRKYSEFVDFMLLGCELQKAGKHPRVWAL